MKHNDEPLTEREVQVLKLLMKGLSHKKIADEIKGEVICTSPFLFLQAAYNNL